MLFHQQQQLIKTSIAAPSLLQLLKVIGGAQSSGQTLKITGNVLEQIGAENRARQPFLYLQIRKRHFDFLDVGRVVSTWIQT